MPAQLGKALKGAATTGGGAAGAAAGARGRRGAGDAAQDARLEALARADMARRLAATTRKQLKVR